MLVSQRVIDVPQLGAGLSTHAWIGDHFRLHAVRNRGVVCEDDLVLGAIDRRGAVTRPVLTVVLAGRARLRAAGMVHWLEPGDVIVVPRKADVRMRQEGFEYRSIALEWDPTFFAHAPTLATVGRLGARTLERIGAAVDALTPRDASSRTAEPALQDLFALFVAEGLPLALPEPRTMQLTIPAADLRLSRTLDGLLSNLVAKPMGVDFHDAIGISARQLSRSVSAFNTRYGFNAGGWRDTLLRRRITIGAALMCVPGARVEMVARILGYSSPSAFVHAFANAGLPPPGDVLQLARRLA